VFSLAALYLILFSPRTENNTYAMLGPAIGVFMAGAFLIEKRTREGILLAGLTLALIVSRPIERLLAPTAEPIWMPPMIGVVFCAYVLVRLLAPVAQPAGQAPRGDA
jgi:hypothetical protein